jgi:type IV secretory pathway TrbF-like protein
MGSGIQHRTMERVTEIYVAVFPVVVSGNRKAEVILAGYQKSLKSPHMTQIRATVETHVEAVPSLVELCDEIVDEQAEIESYRLLKFDKDGVHILNPDQFRAFEQQYDKVHWSSC